MSYKRHSRSSEMSQFDRPYMVSYYYSIALALSRTVSYIQPDIGQKSQHLYSVSLYEVTLLEFLKDV